MQILMKYSSTNQKKIIFYISHIYDIVFFMRVNEILSNFKISIKLEILLHPKFVKNKKVLNLLSNNFHNYKIIPFDLIYTINPLKNIIRSVFLKIWFKKLEIKNHLFVTLDKSQFVSKFLLNRFKDIVLIQQVEDEMRGYKINIKLNIYYNILNLLSSSKFMKYYSLENSGNHIYKHVFFRYNRPFLLFQTRLNSFNPRFTLPLLSNIKTSNKIVIFGSRFNSWSYLNSKSKRHILNFYQSINILYPNYIYFYIPHPLEKDSEFNEIQSIFNGKLKFVNSYVSSESFLYFNRDIYMCLSIGSTSSHSAYEMGFNSKVFYKLLNLDKNIAYTYDQIFTGLPSKFFISEFDEISVPVYKKDEPYLQNLLSIFQT